MVKPTEPIGLEPLTNDDGEVRELTSADFARCERGAPWARKDETARLIRALDDVIAAAERQDSAACHQIATRALAGEEV
ncbi:MAG: hypothetical protein ACKVGZ_12315 [Alphaproteobacteria bacterium]|jgi:hypothetical protein